MPPAHHTTSFPHLPRLLAAPACLLCSSWTNKLITAKDHGSVQLNVGHLDEAGVYTNSFTTFALCGQLRIKVGGRAGWFDGLMGQKIIVVSFNFPYHQG